MKYRSLFLAMLCAIAGFAMTSCSDDDDDNPSGNYDTPKYEQYAALYEITSPNTDISSIELTSAGNYVVAKGINSSKASPVNNKSRKSMMLNSFIRQMATRGISTVVEGRYTAIDDNTFELEGFGRVIITRQSDNAVSISIKLSDGTQEELKAAIANQYPSSEMTNKLCRTWQSDEIGIMLKLDGRKLYDKTYPSSRINDLFQDFIKFMKDFDDEDDDDEDYFDEWEISNMPTQVIFSKSGTYLVKYADSSLAIATWTWVDMQNGRLRYSWNYDDMYEDAVAGVINVKFENSKMYIIERMEDEEDDEEDYDANVELVLTWSFKQ